VEFGTGRGLLEERHGPVVPDRLQGGPARLVGHDRGGPVAFILMLRHPEKVAGFSASTRLARS
jgi:hypothetical protein